MIAKISQIVDHRIIVEYMYVGHTVYISFPRIDFKWYYTSKNTVRVAG